MWVWIVAVVIAVALFALAWWVSGRAKGRPGRPDPGAETDRGWATNQALINRDSAGGGVAGI